ncbi:hypothetical protein AVEN_212426-1 [Araneus ventricosus]|uniref:Uncharacterized protein n=1 Tax=Araneus ventricosus TaxID=182803 RepID=A0A4Y2RZC4_ARAVE|nr:hypothetical protein AVEN_212426-1 [Araneus ventricosus]
MFFPSRIPKFPFGRDMNGPLNRTLFQINVLSILERGNSHWEIVKPSDGMLSDGAILLHDNAHTARETQELLQKFKWKVWSLPPYSPDFRHNLGSKHFTGTKFSSKSDVKTYAENCGRYFYQAGLKELVLRSDKCVNRFGNYVEK